LFAVSVFLNFSKKKIISSKTFIMPKNSQRNRRKTKRRQNGHDTPSQFYRLGSRATKRGNRQIAELHFLRAELMEKRKKEQEFFPFAENRENEIIADIDELRALRESDAWCQSIMERLQSLQTDLEHLHEEGETIKDRIAHIDDTLYAIRRFLLNYSRDRGCTWDEQQYSYLVRCAHNALGIFHDWFGMF
jgi:uncharacterized coiled-coil DUF342 family protein